MNLLETMGFCTKICLIIWNFKLLFTHYVPGDMFKLVEILLVVEFKLIKAATILAQLAVTSTGWGRHVTVFKSSLLLLIEQITNVF